MNFEKCKISGNLVAKGNKGEYWIVEGVWKSLYTVTPRKGLYPMVKHISPFHSVEDAIAEAERLDVAEEEI